MPREKSVTTRTASRNRQGRQPASRCRPVCGRSAIDVPAGSFYVPLNQPLAHLAVAALEPGTPVSYTSHGLIESLSDTARVMSTPSLIFEEME